MQDLDDRLEPLEQFYIALPEFVKRSGLFLEYGNDRIGVVTTIDLGSEWVVAEIFSSLLGVLRQCGIENRLEVRGSERCISSRRHGNNRDVGRCHGRGKKGSRRPVATAATVVAAYLTIRRSMPKLLYITSGRNVPTLTFLGGLSARYTRSPHESWESGRCISRSKCVFPDLGLRAICI